MRFILLSLKDESRKRHANFFWSNGISSFEEPVAIPKEMNTMVLKVDILVVAEFSIPNFMDIMDPFSRP